MIDRFFKGGFACFFKGVESAFLDGGVAFEGFEDAIAEFAFAGGGGGVVVGGKLGDQGFDVLGGLGEVLGVDDFVACYCITVNGINLHFVACNFVACPSVIFIVGHGLFLLAGVVDMIFDDDGCDGRFRSWSAASSGYTIVAGYSQKIFGRIFKISGVFDDNTIDEGSDIDVCAFAIALDFVATFVNPVMQ